jgi:ATP-dependent DNA helicase RecQ
MSLSPSDALKQYFGYDAFRPMQQEIIDHVLEGNDGLVLMPTGGGKSICYQIPAIVMPGITIVVSPLIALMRDQVESLSQNGVSARYLNSTLTQEEQQEIMQEAQQGDIDLLYAAPETLLRPFIMRFLRTLDISLIAIDEAHCISSWGHSFRPEYTKLSQLKSEFPTVPMLALTATADEITRRDILSQLHISEAKTFLSSFDRPNISLRVAPGRKKFEQILDFLSTRQEEHGIIYCLSRNSTEQIARKLRKAGFPADAYHAGLDPHERAKRQDDFLYGRTPIMCATIAFGMGIDKSNIRWVIHHNLPKSLEGFYQEIGRAGRDGLPSDTLLFYSLADVIALRKFAEDSANKHVELAKLDRMQQYADALICRRKILLSYFSEPLTAACNNCDVCHNPPKETDATDIVLKALSAVLRTKQSVGVHLLIDVLRGSKQEQIRARGLDRIKTYGAGKDISTDDWQHYVLQMLHLGYISIAYDAGHVVRITPLGLDAIKEQPTITLVSPRTAGEHQEARKKQEAKQTKETASIWKQNKHFDGQLFGKLRDKRSLLAKTQDVPAYLICSDATLEDMVYRLPRTIEEMKQISGIGVKKLKTLAPIMLEIINDHLASKSTQAQQALGGTTEVTYNLYRSGYTVQEIATKRSLKTNTIYQHLESLLLDGYDINLQDFLSKKQEKALMAAIDSRGPKLKPIYEHMKEEIPYEKIRLVVAKWRSDRIARGIIDQ